MNTYCVNMRVPGGVGTYYIYVKAKDKQDAREQLKKKGYNLDNVVSIIQDVRI